MNTTLGFSRLGYHALVVVSGSRNLTGLGVTASAGAGLGAYGFTAGFAGSFPITIGVGHAGQNLNQTVALDGCT